MIVSNVRCWCGNFLKSRYTLFHSRKYQWKTGVYGTPRKTSQDISSTISDEAHPLLNAYRLHGHKKANVNPVTLSESKTVPELDLSRFPPVTGVFLHGKNFSGTLKDAQEELEKVYSGNVGLEFMHLENEAERVWFQERWEQIIQENVAPSVQKNIARELLKSQVLDKFLAIKYVSLKRYGAEGAESQLTFFQELFRIAAENDVEDVVIAAHHRGRLNVMIGFLKMPPEVLFRKLSGKSEYPDEFKTDGDVISHLCPMTVVEIDTKCISVQMTNVPSHLEAVCPVSLGQTRSLQQVAGDGDYSSVEPRNKFLNVQIHGDAAFMGQGVSHENLIMSQLPHFSVGGSVHLIVNNQLGFTTPPPCGRGTRYASDLAKVISAPVVHVNGDFPEDVLKATKIACEYQQKFRKNSFVDLNCYRRWGHNELDDPTFTNPLLYKMITNRTTVPDSYAAKLIQQGIMDESEVVNIKKEYQEFLNSALENTPNFNPLPPSRKYWEGYNFAPNAITTWDTGVDNQLLKMVGLRSVEIPQTFNVHPNILKHHVTSRIQKLENDGNIDWATAEALAMGSLLYNGYNVRISGQDVGRGTFSHRHAMLVDQESDDVYIPLNHISEDQIGHLEIANSFLSEEAVLGFEYGFSTITPNTLVLWEAQFGDFFNGAQIQIDTYVSSGETKWLTRSGLVISLPHGYDGAGPEHSSCRVERFLQMSNSSESRPDGDDVNIFIVNPTTPAQYFHLLRRQMVRNFRKPLIIVGPKILIRSPDAASKLSDMSPGTTFAPVLNDSHPDPSKVRRILFTSGKHYYALQNYKNTNNISNVAIIRLEELSPFPTHQLRTEIAKYKNAKEYIWSQEEPQNMGAWSFCQPRFYNLVGCKLKYSGREPAACPAVGIGEVHKKQAQFVIENPFR